MARSSEAITGAFWANTFCHQCNYTALKSLFVFGSLNLGEYNRKLGSFSKLDIHKRTGTWHLEFLCCSIIGVDKDTDDKVDNKKAR